LPALGAPQAPNSPPASSVAPPPKSYFPTTSTANAQTTAGKESQETGAKAGQEYRSNLAADAAGALEVKRSLAEMANLAASQAPSASNTLRMRIGQFAIASGVDPQKVASWTGIDPGVLEAAKKQTSGLAVASIHQLTNRGTNFDLETFMENNPNLLQTPGGFSRVVQYMNGKSDSIIAKQHDFEQFIKQKGPDGEPLSEDDWHGAHTAHWNQKQLDDIKAGKYNSVAPPEKSTMINGVRYVKQGGVWVQQ
jgi:hypothetical protein